jgi:uncharacterized protein
MEKETFIVQNFLDLLRRADALIVKAQESGMPEAELLEAQVAADMFPLKRQIQILTDICKIGTAKLTGTEAPAYEDTEMSFTDLAARVAKTRTFIESCGATHNIDTESIHLRWMPEGMQWTGAQYTNNYVLANAYFHLVVAYAILRMKGVQLGKADYIAMP